MAFEPQTQPAEVILKYIELYMVTFQKRILLANTQKPVEVRRHIFELTLKPDEIKALQSKFSSGLRKLDKSEWILRGTVVEILGPPNSPRTRPRYLWTRKFGQKTFTVALSKSQYKAFGNAIEENRKLKAQLDELPDHSQKALLGGLPGVQKPKQQKKTT